MVPQIKYVWSLDFCVIPFIAHKKNMITISFYPGNDLSEVDQLGMTIPGEETGRDEQTEVQQWPIQTHTANP